MKKVIIAINNKKKIAKENKDIKIFVHYREAILEILEKDKKIDEILIDENLPGIISMEKLIKKIKKINFKIKIKIILEKENEEKELKLKKLNINNIYINKTNKNKKENKIIAISGNKNSGKTTIINLILIYLINKNKKILLINLNKKTEKEYLVLIKNKINKYEIKKSKIQVNENLMFFYNFEKIFFKNQKEKNKKNFFETFANEYEFIIIDIGNCANYKMKMEVLKKSNKNIVVFDDDLLGIKRLEEKTNKYIKQNTKPKVSLHIIHNKYYFNSISNSIIKKLINQNIKYSTIFYNSKFTNLNKNFLQNKNLKINIFLKYKIKKLLK